MLVGGRQPQLTAAEMAFSCVPPVPGKRRALAMTGGLFYFQGCAGEREEKRGTERERERRWTGHVVGLNSEGADLRRHHVRQLEHLILDRAVSGYYLFKTGHKYT